MTIEELTIDKAEIENRKSITTVTLRGVRGDDLVACCEQKLIGEILDAIGEESVIEHFQIELSVNDE